MVLFKLQWGTRYRNILQYFSWVNLQFLKLQQKTKHQLQNDGRPECVTGKVKYEATYIPVIAAGRLFISVYYTDIILSIFLVLTCPVQIEMNL